MYLERLTTQSSNSTTVSETEKWIQWTYLFVFTDGIAESVYAKVKVDAVRKALMALHRSLIAVDNEFIKVIKELTEGHEIPGVIIPPSPIIPWEDKPDFLNGIMVIVQAALSELVTILSKHISPVLQPVIHALGALITDIEKIIEVFKKNQI